MLQGSTGYRCRIRCRRASLAVGLAQLQRFSRLALVNVIELIASLIAVPFATKTKEDH